MSADLYATWILAWGLRWAGRTAGLCAVATEDMVKAFPELRRVAGWVECDEGLLEHWWCAAEDGTIVDPTASQFSRIVKYHPFEPGSEVRVGRCMNCGMGIYAAVQSLDDPSYARSLCDEPECAEALAREYGSTG